MFQHQNVWLPDGEKHFPEWMSANGEMVDGRGTYQIKKWRACIPWIKRWRNAVDVGSHVGFWTRQLCAKFEFVSCFEPMEEFRECFFRNMDGLGNFCCYPVALGAHFERVGMIYDVADSGGTHVGAGESVKVETLDSLDLHDVDFVKIDCEGYEHHVIDGGIETLKRYRPCVIVEQKPHKLGPNFGIYGTPAVDMLKKLGAIERAVLSGDHILSWN
jgi:FkbM family methyltransferase